ncbi:MAG: NusG domain II-containing protein [Gemmiger sp.]|nr:NusG domain II-containing protein [Gemmiger sp.]
MKTPPRRSVFLTGQAGRRAGMLFTLAVLAVAGGLFWLAGRGKAPGGVAVIRYGQPAQTLRVPLNQEERYTLTSNGYTIHLEVKAGAIAFVDSPCPDHTCETFGWLHATGDWAACLPARATVTIEEGAP